MADVVIYLFFLPSSANQNSNLTLSVNPTFIMETRGNDQHILSLV